MSYILTVGLNPALQKVFTFPRLDLDAVNRAAAAATLASGKGINVARTLALLGRRVVATGILGGPTGAAIEADLKREGIPSAFTAIAAPTRICVTIEDRGRKTTTELIEPSPAVTDGEVERWVHAFESLVPWAGMVVVSGTTPAGMPAGLYRRLIAFARAQGKPVVLDCGGDLWREGAAAEPDVLKCNEAEFCDALQTRRLSPAKLAAEARKRVRGATRWVVVTRGAKPALFAASVPGPGSQVQGPPPVPGPVPEPKIQGQAGSTDLGPRTLDRIAWWAAPPRVRAVNTVGSGDAVTAGMVSAMLDGAPPETVIRRAVACGTANALVTGPGILRPDDVKRLEKEVRLKPA
jgi:tagatose 6-phosphate kinase